jgi:putative transposase
LKGAALIVNGMPDHVHALLRLRPNGNLSDCMRVVKTNSSRWIHDKWPERRRFAWQTGFAAFTVSASNCDSVRRYIERQEQHHRQMSFQEELVAFLKKHGIEYDKRYIWT